MKQAVLIGAGNVGWHLGHVLEQHGMEILQVYSRKNSKAKALGKALECPICTDLNKIKGGADLYIIAVKDDAIVREVKFVTFGTYLRQHLIKSFKAFC